MTAVELLRLAGELGLVIRPEGANLYIEPADRLTPDLLAEIRLHKTEILTAITVSPVQLALGGLEPVADESLTAAEVAAMPLAEFAAASLVVTVTSRVLDEVILLASDNAVLDPGEQRVVYRAAELMQLSALAEIDPKGLRAIHELKRTFKGAVTDSAPACHEPGTDPRQPLIFEAER